MSSNNLYSLKEGDKKMDTFTAGGKYCGRERQSAEGSWGSKRSCQGKENMGIQENLAPGKIEQNSLWLAPKEWSSGLNWTDESGLG